MNEERTGKTSSGLCTQCLAYLFTLDYVMKYFYSQTSAKLFQRNYIKVTILMVSYRDIGSVMQ
jgi:hypothetical protein